MKKHVLETQERIEPVKIGLLQRYATDILMKSSGHPYKRSEDNGKKVAIVGGGPAGLSCAHRLSMKGYSVTIFDLQVKTWWFK